MTNFLETHEYLPLMTKDGRKLLVTRAYIRMLEEAPDGGTYITVADQASTRHVVENIEMIRKELIRGTVRYAAQ